MEKIIEGHSFDDYQEKYGKKFKDGKLEFVPFSKTNKLNSDKKYWKIDDKKPGYYEITDKNPLVFFLSTLGAIGVVTAIVVTSVMLTRPKPTGGFCTFTFNSEHSQIEVDGKKEHKIDISLKKGEKPTEIYFVYADDGYELPSDRPEDLPDIIDYVITDGTKAKLSFNSTITNDIAIKMPAIPVGDKVQFHFTGTNCKIKVNDDYVADYTFSLEKGEKPAEPYYIKANDNFILPTDPDVPVVITYTRTDDTNATLTFNRAINEDVDVDNIVAIPPTIKKWYEFDNWWDYCSCDVKGVEAGKDDIGQTVQLKVNNQPHNVRLIGLDHDDLVDGSGKAHTTFQFTNVICDENGHSLSTIYDYKENPGDADINYGYLNSVLRKGLTGSGEGELRWYQKGGRVYSKEPNYSKPVFDMIDEKVSVTFKCVNKEVGTIKNYDSTLPPEGQFELTDYQDRLFVLTFNELNYSPTPFTGDPILQEGSPYDYYQQHQEITDYCYTQIDKTNYADCTFVDDYAPLECSSYNYAGYYDGDEISSTLIWISSPIINTCQYVGCMLYGKETVYTTTTCNGELLSVVPAFCI